VPEAGSKFNGVFSMRVFGANMDADGNPVSGADWALNVIRRRNDSRSHGKTSPHFSPSDGGSTR
jgi:hypothetical protein